MNPSAQLDPDDLAQQVEWYRAEKLIETTADGKDMLDAELNGGR